LLTAVVLRFRDCVAVMFRLCDCPLVFFFMDDVDDDVDDDWRFSMGMGRLLIFLSPCFLSGI
jgi:hypothetical protein